MYSTDVHAIVFRLLRSGSSIRKTATTIGIGSTTVHRWKNASHWNQQRKSRTRRFSKAYDDVIISHLTCRPWLEIKALHRILKQSDSACPSLSTLARCAKRLGFRRHRLSSKPLGEPSKEALLRFFEKVDDLIKPGATVVSLDECHFSRRVWPLYGYSRGVRPSIRRCKMSDTKENRRQSLLLGMCSDGSLHHDLCHGSVNRVRFLEFIENLPYPSGTIILLDNCSIHHGEASRQAFERRGYIPLYLPPYSPQFQPVELCFSKIKHSYRQMYPWASDDIRGDVNTSMEDVSSTDIVNWFDHCYTQIKSQKDVFRFV